MKIALAQMNPTVGDLTSNARKILAWVRKASKAGADLVVFPELAVTGYPVWDLANKTGFVKENLRVLEKIASATRGVKTPAVMGFIDEGERTEEKEGPGSARQRIIPRRHYNALAWIENGAVRFKQHKRLLPTYDVFLEEIFFEPGTAGRLIPWRGRKVIPTICEDIWDDDYDIKPLEESARAGGNFAVNISASPYYRGVASDREALLKSRAARYGIPLLYVNQVGAQDDLIFDGRSLLVDERGRVLFRAPAFREGLFFYEFRPGRKAAAALPEDPISNQPAEMHQALILGIRDYCRKNGFQKLIIGLSGGIDSALVAALAAEAMGPKAVLGVTMPSAFSSRGSWEDSRELAERLGLEFRMYPIRRKYDFLIREYRKQARQSGKRTDPKKITLAMENLQARLRGMELMYLSNDEGRLLLSTGNKSELAMGYCTLYGDMAGGLSVLGDVYKTDVYRLSRYCNRKKEVIPKEIILKAPSAELRPNQKDQDSLPPYEILDEILYLYIEKNKGREEIVRALGERAISAAVIGEVIRKVDHNEYKRRQTPPILRVTEKAWFGRRMPITNHYERS